MRDPKLVVYGDAEHARRYALRWDSARGRARDARKQRALAAAFEHLAPFTSVLDAPCGAGRLCAFLSTERAYIGVDLAPAMLGEARARQASARFAVGDLTRLPLADHSVDVAVCVRLLHLVRERSLRVAILAELARVARIGVVVDFRHAAALRTWLGRLRARTGLRARPHNAHALSSVADEFTAAGLGPPVFVPVRRPAWLSDKMVAAARVRGATRTAWETVGVAGAGQSGPDTPT
ncbi:MAG: class I SAM-dependent methyltransferase [Planctomycetes bacterium]|nr:class I SAM-dependent methyltransferase [Planctomycetota bacterium]